VLPTVEQARVAWKSFPRWRVDARVQQHSPSLRGGDVRVQVAAAVESARSMYFLSMRARKAVMAAGSVRDGP
jgi:hypothetical protein